MAVLSRQAETELQAKFAAITVGDAKGHFRRDVPRNRGVRFENVKPFVVAFRTADRVIIRIVHGARDMRRVFRSID